VLAFGSCGKGLAMPRRRESSSDSSSPRRRRRDRSEERDTTRRESRRDDQRQRTADGGETRESSRAGRHHSAERAAPAQRHGEPDAPSRDSGEARRTAPRSDVKAEEDLESYRKRKIAQVESLGRSGGVYIPPYKMARLMEEIKDKTSPEFQRQAWEALRKSINGLVNKVNVSNIKNLVEELFQENLIRGRGLLVRSMIRAQMASPGFTHVFAALVAILNSKLPEIGDLLLRRIILQFRRAYKRNDKIVTIAVIKFMAHLVNQKVVSELLALHIATLLLERVTDDSIEVAVNFIQECGQAMKELSPAGSNAIFERFKSILHEGVIDRRVQYVIEGLMEVRRKKFEDFPMVLPELDLVDEEDQITHEVDLLDENIKGEETLNIFKAQPPEQYLGDEAKWKQISNEILGVEGDDDGSSEDSEDDEAEEAADQQATQKIVDCTEQDLVNLRRSIYLVIMSSLHYEECVHKILRLNITEGQEGEVCTMLIDCCAMERMFNRFFALQGERLCRLNPKYQENFEEAFGIQYNTVHRLETNKLRNIGKFFAHLLYTDAISWAIIANVRITEETTTSSSRIFIKVIFQELSEQWGIKKLCNRLQDPELQQHFAGLFPKDHPKNVRFSINYFTAIGLGILTEDLRGFLDKAGSQMAKETGMDMDETTASSESESSSDDDSSSSSSSS